MSISNINGTGKMNNPLYYYTVYFRTNDNKKAGNFSFVSDYNITTKNELSKFIWDKGSGSIWKTIKVSGSYIDVDADGEKIGFIRTIGTNYSPSYDVNINYSHYKESTNIINGSNYTFTNAIIDIERYVI